MALVDRADVMDHRTEHLRIEVCPLCGADRSTWAAHDFAETSGYAGHLQGHDWADVERCLYGR